MHPRFKTAIFASTPARRRQLRLLSFFCAALVLLVAPGIAAAATGVPVQQTGDSAGGATVNVGASSLGQILVDANGMTLYLFDNDEPGKSNCDDACLRRWPPLLADAGAAPTAGSDVSATLGTIQRDDGATQVTANDMPLYYWFEDKQPGDVLGQAVGDVWWVLAPDGTAIRTAAAAGDTGQTAGATTTGDTTAAGDVTGTAALSDTAATDTMATDTMATDTAGADVITNTTAMTDTGATGTGGASDTGAADTSTTAGASNTTAAGAGSTGDAATTGDTAHRHRHR